MFGQVLQLLSVATDGAAVANTAAATSLLPAGGTKTLQAGFLAYVGQEFSIRAAGRISNIVTAPGTLTFSFKLGATVVASSPAFALNVVAKTNVTWRLQWDFTLRAVGAAANLLHTGEWRSESVVGSPVPAVGGVGSLMIPASAPVVGANFDSRVSLLADLTATWSVADPGNSIQLQQYRIFSGNDIFG